MMAVKIGAGRLSAISQLSTTGSEESTSCATMVNITLSCAEFAPLRTRSSLPWTTIFRTHPDEVPKLLTRLSEGYDVVYGTPLKESHGLLRDLASRITKVALQNAMGAETAKNVSAFRVFRSNLRVAFDRYSGPYVSIDVLLTWSTQRFSAIPVENRPRSGGVSGYTTRKLITHAMNMLTGFSTLPLQIGSIHRIHFDGIRSRDSGFSNRPLSDLRRCGSRVLFPGLYHLDILWSTTVCARNFWGIFSRVHTRTMDKPPYAVEATTDGRWRRPRPLPCVGLGFRVLWISHCTCSKAFLDGTVSARSHGMVPS